jgi:hypothetical protein
MHMNKRIKELALQVAAMETDTTLIMYDDEIARFAELIIKEVFAVTNTIKANYLRNQLATTDFGEKNIFAEGQNALNHLDAELQRRFGVEPAKAEQNSAKRPAPHNSA